MKTTQILLALLIPLYPLNAGLSEAESQSATNITTLVELKESMTIAPLHELLRSMDSWLPNLVTSIHWQTQMSPNFLLHYYIDVHDEDDALFDTLLLESDKMYTQLNVFFDIRETTKQETLAQQTRLVCFVIKTRTGITFGSMIDPHTLFFFLDTKKTPNYMGKFRHEYAHWVWGRLYGEAPSLFWEGLATYAEKMSSPDADMAILFDGRIDLEKIPPLQEVAINENFWKHKGMYTVGSLWIHFLVEKWGWEPLKRFFLISNYEDTEVLEHFSHVYGKSLEEVDLEWREFVKAAMKTAEEAKKGQ